MQDNSVPMWIAVLNDNVDALVNTLIDNIRPHTTVITTGYRGAQPAVMQQHIDNQLQVLHINSVWVAKTNIFNDINN